MRRFPHLPALLGLGALAVVAASSAPAAAGPDAASRLRSTVDEILAQPYQPAYVPSGFDTAFGDANVLDTASAQDYTSGSIPGSPDHPDWPAAFKDVSFKSGDHAPLFGKLALHDGTHPGIVVAHGFNTNGKESVVRWAAMLYASGYDVLAADQRDFKYESDNGYGYPKWQQTFGWKESKDIVAAGKLLAAQPGVRDVGLVGFSEGAQNVVLALAGDSGHVFKAGLAFSPPADQDTQIYSTALPPGCETPFCGFPVTEALVNLVVPPYNTGDPCTVLGNAADRYHTTGFSILARENAFHRQVAVRVPLLSFYANDDPLVQPFQATMMAGYERGNPLQRTILIERGAHAYYYDRWWQQRAILLYFKALLPSAADDASVTTDATVTQTPGGEPLASQLVDLGQPTRADADALLAPFICDTSQGPPGAAEG